MADNSDALLVVLKGLMAKPRLLGSLVDSFKEGRDGDAPQSPTVLTSQKRVRGSPVASPEILFSSADEAQTEFKPVSHFSKSSKCVCVCVCVRVCVCVCVRTPCRWVCTTK